MSVLDGGLVANKKTKHRSLKSFFNFLHLPGKSRRKSDSALPTTRIPDIPILKAPTLDEHVGLVFTSLPDPELNLTLICQPTNELAEEESHEVECCWSKNEHEDIDQKRNDITENGSKHEEQNIVTEPKTVIVEGDCRNEEDNSDDGVFFNESYFEDDYCQDYRELPTSSTSDEDEWIDVETCSHTSSIKMGVSSLFKSTNRINVADGQSFSDSPIIFETPKKLPSDFFRRFTASRKASRRRRFNGSGTSSREFSESESESTSMPDERENAEYMANLDIMQTNLTSARKLYSLNIAVEQQSILSDTNNCHVPETPDKRLTDVALFEANGMLNKAMNTNCEVVTVDVHVDSNRNIFDSINSTEFPDDSPKRLMDITNKLPLSSRRVRRNACSEFPNLPGLVMPNTPSSPKPSLRELREDRARRRNAFRACRTENSCSVLDKGFIASKVSLSLSPPPLNGSPVFDLRSDKCALPPDGTEESKFHILIKRSIQSKTENRSFPSSSESDLSPGDFLPMLVTSSADEKSRKRTRHRKGSHRRSIESGYFSSKPPSPELHGKFTLASVGSLPSPSLLNRLDGLDSPKSNFSPKFKFPATSPLDLKPVPESKEQSSTSPSECSEVHSPTGLHTPITEFRTVMDRKLSSVSENRINKWIESISACTNHHPNLDISENGAFAREIPIDPSNSSVDVEGIKVCRKQYRKRLQSSATILNENKENTGPPSTPKRTSSSQSMLETPKEKRMATLHPVSTSSPMHKTSRIRISEHEPNPSSSVSPTTPVSPVTHNKLPNTVLVREVTSRQRRLLKKKQRDQRRQKRLNSQNSAKDDQTASSIEADTFIKNRSPESDEENSKISSIFEQRLTLSSDYMVLKNTAEYVFQRIYDPESIREWFNVAKVMEHFHNYLKSGKDLRCPDLKNHRSKSKARISHFLTLENCMDLLTLSCLHANDDATAACLDFSFENLHKLATRSDFHKVPHELALVILGNDHSWVHNRQGFPFTFVEGEKQVLRAIDKYVRANPIMGPDEELKSKTNKLFMKVLLKSAFGLTGYRLNEDSSSASSVDRRLKNAPHRSYYEIALETSKTFVTALDTRQEYLFQPFLSDDSDQNMANSERENGDFTEVSQEPVSAEHVLKKLFFSFRRHNKVPHMTRISMQYTLGSKKVTKTIGSPKFKRRRQSSESASGPHSKNSPSQTPKNSGSPHLRFAEYISDKSALSTPSSEGHASPQNSIESENIDIDLHSPVRTTCLTLKPGEHVTGVAIQGEAVLHNIEVRTSMGNRVRAHNLATPGVTVPWNKVPAPCTSDREYPYCLHAFRGKVCKPSTRPYIRDLEVVWAKVIVPHNDLELQKALDKIRSAVMLR